MVALLIIIAVVCFAAGVFASSRWLPELGDGPLGTIAFFILCGLCGAVVALVGINIDAMVRETRHTNAELSAIVIGNSLISLLHDAGALAGLALIAYLLAPKPPSDGASPLAAEPGYSEHP